MQYQIDNFKLRVDSQAPLDMLLKRKYRIKEFTYKILSRSIDARHKNEVVYVYRILIDTKEELLGKDVSIYEAKQAPVSYPKWTHSFPPIIVGFGPAGIFASLYLARCGAKPIIVERGSAMDQRVEDVEVFLKTKKLNPNSNVQFGEGGAGAFSDGKLNTNVKNPLIQFILEELYQHGAKEDILYDSMPHVGTDVLREVVKNIRNEIISLGGTFHFNTLFKTIKREEDYAIAITDKATFKTRHLLLGIGHSAKDTIRHLYQELGVQMEPKAFSMGVRVEHNAEKISQAQYGDFAQYLPKAYYKLAHHTKDRGVYTFCMCPGGYVLASTSEENTIVTNGMSNQKREGANSNSAILVDVKPIDYGNGVLDGLAYQEKYERLAYEVSHDYRAPANLMKEFLEDKVAKEIRSIKPSYPHGLIFTDLHNCLPEYVIEGIKEGILAFDKKLHGFNDKDAILIGIESRSSSPVRILRDEKRQSNHPFLYPIGEGAGYAGGITSAALDGLKTAMSIVEEK